MAEEKKQTEPSKIVLTKPMEAVRADIIGGFKEAIPSIGAAVRGKIAQGASELAAVLYNQDPYRGDLGAIASYVAVQHEHDAPQPAEVTTVVPPEQTTQQPEATQEQGVNVPEQELGQMSNPLAQIRAQAQQAAKAAQVSKNKGQEPQPGE